MPARPRACRKTARAVPGRRSSLALRQCLTLRTLPDSSQFGNHDPDGHTPIYRNMREHETGGGKKEAVRRRLHEVEPAPQGGGEGGWLGGVVILGNHAAAVCRTDRIRTSDWRDR